MDLEDFSKPGQWGHILTSSDGIKGGKVWLKLGANLWVSTLTLPDSFKATGNDVMMMSCNSLVVTIGLNTLLETWRGNW